MHTNTIYFFYFFWLKRKSSVFVTTHVPLCVHQPEHNLLTFFLFIRVANETKKKERKKNSERNDENGREKKGALLPQCKIKLHTNESGRACSEPKNKDNFILLLRIYKTYTQHWIFRCFFSPFFLYFFFTGNDDDDDATNEFAKRVLSALNHDDDCHNNFLAGC